MKGPLTPQDIPSSPEIQVANREHMILQLAVLPAARLPTSPVLSPLGCNHSTAGHCLPCEPPPAGPLPVSGPTCKPCCAAELALADAGHSGAHPRHQTTRNRHTPELQECIALRHPRRAVPYQFDRHQLSGVEEHTVEQPLIHIRWQIAHLQARAAPTHKTATSQPAVPRAPARRPFGRPASTARRGAAKRPACT